MADYERERRLGYQKIAPQGMIRLRLTTLTGFIIVAGVAGGVAFVAMGADPKMSAILFLVDEVLFFWYLPSWQGTNQWVRLLAVVLVSFLLGVAISKIFIWSQIILRDILKSAILILAIIALVRDFLNFISNNELSFRRVLIEASLIFFVECTFGWKCWDWLEGLAPWWLWIIGGTLLLWLVVMLGLQEGIFAALWRKRLLEEEGSEKRWKWMTLFVGAAWLVSMALFLFISMLVGDVKGLDNATKALVMLLLGGSGMLSLLEILVLGEFPRKVRLHYPEGILPEECWLIDIDREFYYVVVTPHPELQDSIRVETRAKDKVKRIIFLEN